MTVGAWILFGFISLVIILFSCAIVFCCDLEKGGMVATFVIAAVLVIATYVGIHWYMFNTASGQRAQKTQESNFGGGLNRIVTVYSYNGDAIKSWEGQFDVTENEQETWFDIDGRRVIIQGGIIINEEVSNAER